MDNGLLDVDLDELDGKNVSRPYEIEDDPDLFHLENNELEFEKTSGFRI